MTPEDNQKIIEETNEIINDDSTYPFISYLSDLLAKSKPSDDAVKKLHDCIDKVAVALGHDSTDVFRALLAKADRRAGRKSRPLTVCWRWQKSLPQNTNKNTLDSIASDLKRPLAFLVYHRAERRLKCQAKPKNTSHLPSARRTA